VKSPRSHRPLVCADSASQALPAENWRDNTVAAFHCALNTHVPGDLDEWWECLIYMTNHWPGYGDWEMHRLRSAVSGGWV